MNIKEMHYDFKQKLNKIDSQQYRNLRIPEIDWKLNEACEIFIKNIAEPRINNHLGFEVNQRTIDDIRTLVVNDKELSCSIINPKSYISNLPNDYLFYVSSEVNISKNNCNNIIARCKIKQHDDTHEQSPFDKSSFEWREVNIRFYEKGIKIFTDETFVINSLILNYIKKHPYLHNAEDYPTGIYNLPSGIILTGIQNCILPEQTHREIVDIAVSITSLDLSASDYALKQTKLSLN